MFHAFGAVGAGVCGPAFGMKSVLPSPIFNAEANLKAIESEKSVSQWSHNKVNLSF